MKKLEEWFKRVARPLPWRATQDPYRIWVSEIMLQQTQVVTVIGYYEKFISQFSTVEALAAAEESEVYQYWSGLGYYSRARNLHKGARYIVNDLKSKFPQTREEILEVPGIGPYTAGAILSIAFNLREAIVDGNVQRVFARYYAKNKPIESLKTFFWETSEAWVKKCESPRVFNQALMELGATVCTKSSPRCEICPLKKGCLAFSKNLQSKIPQAKKRTATKDLFWVGKVYQYENKFWLTQDSKWWKGLWNIEFEELANKEDVQKSVEKLSKKGRLLSRHIHRVTHHKISVYPMLLPGTKKLKKGKWFTLNDIKKIGRSSLVDKILFGGNLL